MWKAFRDIHTVDVDLVDHFAYFGFRRLLPQTVHHRQQFFRRDKPVTVLIKERESLAQLYNENQDDRTYCFWSTNSLTVASNVKIRFLVQHAWISSAFFAWLWNGIAFSITFWSIFSHVTQNWPVSVEFGNATFLKLFTWKRNIRQVTTWRKLVTWQFHIFQE